VVHDVTEEEDIYRIRFLTSHPNYFSTDIMEAVAELPRLMPHFEVPVQAGNDEVLENMKRGYTAQQYRELVAQIRQYVPEAAINTDIIVGFPGETDVQFMDTYHLLEELELDKAHLAMYSPRPGTVSDRRMEDDVPRDEKKRRHHMLDDLQERVVAKINAKFLGETVEVLVEDNVKGKWRGRTPQNKLVFFQDDRTDWRGKLANVEVTWTGPWSMQARLPGSEPDSETPPEIIPLTAV
jgi:tRNA-2-methylthio-N6-dimethylallyladenosine synthase